MVYQGRHVPHLYLPTARARAARTIAAGARTFGRRSAGGSPGCAARRRRQSAGVRGAAAGGSDRAADVSADGGVLDRDAAQCGRPRAQRLGPLRRDDLRDQPPDEGDRHPDGARRELTRASCGWCCPSRGAWSPSERPSAERCRSRRWPLHAGDDRPEERVDPRPGRIRGGSDRARCWPPAPRPTCRRGERRRVDPSEVLRGV